MTYHYRTRFAFLLDAATCSLLPSETPHTPLHHIVALRLRTCPVPAPICAQATACATTAVLVSPPVRPSVAIFSGRQPRAILSPFYPCLLAASAKFAHHCHLLDNATCSDATEGHWGVLRNHNNIQHVFQQALQRGNRFSTSSVSSSAASQWHHLHHHYSFSSSTPA